MAVGVVLKAGETAAASLEKAAKVTEVTMKEIGECRDIAPINLEVITSQSLESIIECNAQKYVTINEIPTKEFRALTEAEAKHIQELTGMSDATIKDCTINEEKIVHLKCINEGKLGEVSDVPYIQKNVEVNSVQIQVVVPEFPNGVFECYLPKEALIASDITQFEYCTSQLEIALKTNPELTKQFTAQQISQIMNGAPRISGFTWHHCAESGRMQLVPTTTHNAFRHTGGKAIWGGGRN